MPTPPKARKQSKALIHHDHTRQDPYYWLNERDNPEVMDLVQAENAYTEEMLEPIKSLRETLFTEMKARIPGDEDSVPYRWKGHMYQTRYREGGEYPTYVRWPEGKPEQEELLLDENELAEGKAFCDVGDWSVSPDNRLLAYTVDFQGRRLYTLKVRDIATGKDLDLEVPGTAGEFEWADDCQTLFYIDQEPQTLRNHKLKKVRLDQPNPVEVYFEPDEQYDLTLDIASSEEYLFCTAFSKTNTEVRYLQANQPEANWKVFLPRSPKHEYEVDHLGDQFLIKSNREATNYRLLSCPVNNTDPNQWKAVVPHDPKSLIEGFEWFDRWLAVEVRRNGLTELDIYSWPGLKKHTIRFEEPVYQVSIHQNPETDADWLRYRFTSLAIPPTIVDYHMESGEKQVRKQKEVLGDFDPNRYTTERHWATASDGTRIPISLVYRSDQKVARPQPLLLYGYGSYGISVDPVFSYSRLSLLDRGVAFAITHIRGGSEMGRHWYEEQGKLQAKQNTFTDFIACAEHLILENITTPDQLAIMGGSAGGMLMGTVVNMRPDLFKAAVAAVPFVDVLTTMLDPSIPLTTQEYEEWGNPEVEDVYHYMLGYSPYDNIAHQEYPAILAASGFHDSQVQYWEPLKWVAKLRDHQRGKAPILLHMNVDVGHGGASGRYEALKEVALYYAFVLMQLNRT